MQRDVFISYSKDAAPAAQVCDHLERAGVTCWMAPRDIPGGVDYGGAIVEALRASRVMVLLFSTASNESQQVLREVKIAAELKLPILPIRVEPVTPSPSMTYYLGGYQWLDAFDTAPDQYLERLARDVKAIVGPAAAAPVVETSQAPSPSQARLHRKVERLMDEAEEFESKGDFAGAVKKYDEALEIEPEDVATAKLRAAAARKIVSASSDAVATDDGPDKDEHELECDGEPPPRPAVIDKAAKLLMATIWIGVIGTLFDKDVYDSARIFALNALTIVFVSGVQYLIIKGILSGRAWVRTLYVVLFFLGTAVYVVGVVAYAVSVPEEASISPIGVLASVVSVVLHSYAAVLLLGQEGRAWFRAMKSSGRTRS